jgi:hypothetical protein
LDWPETLSTATVAILAVWLGATVLSRAPGDRSARYFSLLAFVLACWAGSRALEPLADPAAASVLHQVRDASGYLLPAVLAHLVAAFTRSRIGIARATVIVLGYATSVPLAIRAFVAPDSPLHVDPPHFSMAGIGGEVFGWGWIVVRLLLLAAAAWWAWRHLTEVRTDASRNRRAASVLGAVLLGGVGGALLILPTLSRPPIWFSVSLVGLGLVCATYAVFAQRVFLAPDVARRAVSSSLLGGLLVVALIAILTAIDAIADQAFGVGVPIVTALALALSLAVYDPARQAWRRLALGRGAARIESVMPRGIGVDRLSTQYADDGIGPALSRLAWRFDLTGVRLHAGDGGVLAEAGVVSDGQSLEIELPELPDAETGRARLSIGPKRSGAAFTDAERLVIAQFADYVAAAMELGARQRQHAHDRTLLAAEREAHESTALALAQAVETRVPAVLRVHALGSLLAEIGDEPITRWGGKKAGSRQAEGIFAFLFDRGERGVAKDEFLDLIWPDVPLARSDVAFHRTMNGLRRTLARAGAGVVFANDRYRLRADAVAWSDVGAFDIALAAAGSADDSETARRALIEARALYRGDYLDDCPYYGDSAEVEEHRSVLRQRLVDVLLALGKLHEAVGDRPGAADAFRQALVASFDDCPLAAEGLQRLGAHA